MVDQYRGDEARRRREALAASWSLAPSEPGPAHDGTLALMFLCCHPALSAGSAIPLTLRAVGGLSTREIAVAFVVPEPTMAQRISRAKASLRAVGASFAMPSPGELCGRLRLVLHVLYLVFNEGYSASSGTELTRPDLSGEAIRLARSLHQSLPDTSEVTALLALMLLTDARRPARSGAGGELIPLDEQDRNSWDRSLVAEGSALLSKARQSSSVGEYQVQAAIAALHDEAGSHAETNWGEIASLYHLLEEMTGNPMVALNRAVAVAMAESPAVGLSLLDAVDASLGDHPRLHAVRAHLLALNGDTDAATAEFRAAAARIGNVREQHYLADKAATLSRQR